MRRLVLTIALLAALAAGCGGDSGSGSEGPLDEALGYLPADAPFAVAISTDTGSDQFKAADKILGKFPFAGQVRSQLKQSLRQGDVDYEKDLKPLLGNDFVVGTDDPKELTGGDSNKFVGAIQVKDKGKLEDLARKDSKEIGEKSGAKLYQSKDGNVAAVRDDVLVVADSRPTLEAALAQREKDDRLRADPFNKALEGLPKDALVRVYGDLQGLLKSDPGAQPALKVKWLAALRTLGISASVEDDAVVTDFHVKTEGDLTDQDLPIASGDEAPPVVTRPGEIAFGLRRLAQSFKFGEQTAQATDPSGFGDYLTARKQLERKLGIDVQRDLIDQFSGNASVSVDVRGKFGLRSELQDPRRFESTLEKLADRLPDVARQLGGKPIGIAKPKGGQDFYALATPDGQSFAFGVVDDAFVLANDSGKAGALAAAKPEVVDGAKGAVVMRANAQELAQQALQSFGGVTGLQGIGASLFLGPLGDLTGSLSSSPDGLRGSIRLSFD